MQIKVLTGAMKGVILSASVVDESQLAKIDFEIEFIVDVSPYPEYNVGMKFRMTDEIAENILFERYKKVNAVIA